MGSYTDVSCHKYYCLSHQQTIRYITWMYTIADNASLITTTQKSPGMWRSKVHCAFIFKAQAPLLDCLLKMKAL